jgi:hypothetical protein
VQIDRGTAVAPDTGDVPMPASGPPAMVRQPAPGGNRLPVFIHSSWRTSSTWLWLKFRQVPNTLCFYEPFNPMLGTVTRGDAETLNPQSWNSHHPGDAPYLLEFVPLIRRSGGVRAYQEAMEAEWFVPIGGMRGDLRREELSYVALLLRLAQRADKTPVLGFTRSLGRLPALKSRFPGTHILLRRNLWAQWMSFLDQKRQGNLYFYLAILKICRTKDDRFLSFLRDFYLNRALARYCSPDQLREDRSTEDGLGLDAQLLLSLPESEVFALFVTAHIYLYLQGELSADVVVDATRLGTDAAYRKRTERQLAERTGLPVSLADASHRQQFAEFDVGAIDWKEIARHVQLAVRALDEIDRRRLRPIADALFNATRDEARANEPYLPGTRRRLRIVARQVQKLAAEKLDLPQRLTAVIRARDEASAERDRLAQEVREREAGAPRGITI